MNKGIQASVVIPAYNVENTIVRAIDSVQNSISYCKKYYPELQVDTIVVNDFSEDKTSAVVNEYIANHSGITFIGHKRNFGAGAARNTGVRNSFGDFIFFLDADDMYLDEHIYFCIDTLIKNPIMHYVVSKFKIDENIHKDWKPAINASGPVNVCVRRWVHDCIGGFREETIFKEYGNEDIVYRLMLNYFITKPNAIVTETVQYFRYPGNSLDRQMERFSKAPGEYNDFYVLTDKQKTLHAEVQKLQEYIVKEFEERMIHWMNMLAGKNL